MVPEFLWSSFLWQEEEQWLWPVFDLWTLHTSQFQPEPMNYYMSKMKAKRIYFVHCIIMMCLRGLHIRKPYLFVLDINLTTISIVPFFNYTFLSTSVRSYKVVLVQSFYNTRFQTALTFIKLFQLLVSLSRVLINLKKKKDYWIEAIFPIYSPN